MNKKKFFIPLLFVIIVIIILVIFNLSSKIIFLKNQRTEYINSRDWCKVLNINLDSNELCREKSSL